MIGGLELFRTDPSHIGSAPLLQDVNQVKDLDSRKNLTKTKNTFESYLLNAAQYVNEKQISSDAMAEKLLTDPESVDVHDVTIAMAEASLSLNIAQNVIDRIVKGWTEITTTR